MAADGKSHYAEILPTIYDAEIKKYTKTIRNHVYNFNPKDNNRLNTVDFIERYLGYSTCVNAPGKKFKKTSTKDAIRMFYKHKANSLKTEDLCKELIDTLETAHKCFAGLSNIGFTKDNKFNGLFATTTMVLSKLINALQMKEKNIKLILNKLDKIIIPPENQNTSTIWKFQSEWVLGFLDELATTEQIRIEKELPLLVNASRMVME